MHTTSTRPFCAFSLRAFARSATLSGVAAVILGVTAPFASAARPDLLMAGASVQGNSYTVTKSLLGPPGISGPDRFEFVGEKKLQDLFFFQDGDGSGTLSSATFVGVGGVKLMANTSAFADTPVASFQFATVSLERLRTQVIRVTGSGALTITVVQGTQTATKTAEIIAPGPASRGVRTVPVPGSTPFALSASELVVVASSSFKGRPSLVTEFLSTADRR